MDRIVDILIGSFDWGYMLSVNVLTYFVIKTIDSMNGPKKVPVWLKRVIAIVCGIILGLLVVGEYSNILLYSFILSLVSWDALFKPLIKKLKGADYKK